MTTPRLLAAVLVLQSLTLVGQWTGSTPSVSEAQAADFADPAGQRMKMIEELKASNAKMDRLLALLESGKLQVQVPASDDKK